MDDLDEIVHLGEIRSVILEKENTVLLVVTGINKQVIFDLQNKVCTPDRKVIGEIVDVMGGIGTHSYIILVYTSEI